MYRAFPGNSSVLFSKRAESRGFWLLVEGIHVEIQENFKIGVEMRGKFP